MEEPTLQPALPPITLKGSVPLTVEFHPTQHILGVSLITGEVNCYSYTSESTKRLFSSKHHRDSVRCIKFTEDGRQMYSCSVDKSIQIMDLETKKIIRKKAKAHDEGINVIHPISEMVVASGDEGGMVRVWDLRAKSVVQEYKEHEDLVTDMHFKPHKKTLISVSADGYLSVYDIRKPNVLARSDQMEDEMLGIASVRDGSRMVVGNSDGSLSIWNWSWWGDMKDRFPGHPGSVDSLVKATEDIVITGCNDGLIRVLSIHPNKLLGVIGDHDDFPVESLSISHDKAFLASCSHDSTVKFWDVSMLQENDEDSEEEGSAEAPSKAPEVAKEDAGWESVGSEDEVALSDNEPADLRRFNESGQLIAAGIAGADSGSESSEEEAEAKKKRRKKKGGLKKEFKVTKRSKGESFFSGL